MKLLASDRGVHEITVNEGRVVKRDKGVFNVGTLEAKVLKQSGDFAVVGTNFQGTKGFRCGDCNRVNVFRDRCGKCGSTKLTAEA
jgi:hypothetical protein